jgi:hypothetical protein
MPAVADSMERASGIRFGGLSELHDAILLLMLDAVFKVDLSD